MLWLPATGTRAGARLLLRLLDFGAGSGHFALGHVSGQTADVILQEFVFAFEFIVVGLDGIDAFGEGLEGRLEGLGLSGGSQYHHGWRKNRRVLGRRGGDLLLQGLSRLLAQSLQIGRVASGTHGAGVVGREFLLFDFNLGVVSRDEYRGAGFPAGHARALGATSSFGFGVGDGRGGGDGGDVGATVIVGLG